MARCATCGNEVFVGEARCPMCHTGLAWDAPTDAPSGSERPPAGADDQSPPLPLNGASLIVQQGHAGQQGWHDHESATSAERAFGYDPDGRSDFDAVADLVRPERDAQGRIVTDWRYALVGAVVVALLAALAYFVLSGWWTNLNTPTSKVSRVR